MITVGALLGLEGKIDFVNECLVITSPGADQSNPAPVILLIIASYSGGGGLGGLLVPYRSLVGDILRSIARTPGKFDAGERQPCTIVAAIDPRARDLARWDEQLDECQFR